MEIKLKLSEAVKLKNELLGLARQALAGNVKMPMYRNIEALEAVTSPFEKTQKDLFERYGEPFQGDIGIPRFKGDKKDEKNPNYETYMKESESIDTEVSITLESLPAATFSSEKTFEGEMRLIYKYLVQ